MPYPKIPFLFRWYIHRELPGWGRLYSALGLGGYDNINPRWKNAPVVTARGKHHQYEMKLDLARDLDRATYFLGRYYDLPIQLLLDQVLDVGDTFIDGGANTGMMTLHAAQRVGPSGRVIAFEPIPSNCERIEENVRRNHISQVKVINKALGEDSGRLQLNVLGGDTIMATLRSNQSLKLDVRDRFDVDVVRGDDEIEGLVMGKLLLKLDLEGWEYYALLGLSGTIDRYRPPILLEIEPKYLRDAGTDERTLHNWLTEKGYRPYVVGINARWFSAPSIRLAHYHEPRQRAGLDEGQDPEIRKFLGDGEEFIDVIWFPNEFDLSRFSNVVDMSSR